MWVGNSGSSFVDSRIFPYGLGLALKGTPARVAAIVLHFPPNLQREEGVAAVPVLIKPIVVAALAAWCAT